MLELRGFSKEVLNVKRDLFCADVNGVVAVVVDLRSAEEYRAESDGRDVTLAKKDTLGGFSDDRFRSLSGVEFEVLPEENTVWRAFSGGGCFFCGVEYTEPSLKGETLNIGSSRFAVESEPAVINECQIVSHRIVKHI
ncbi:hypothetical protein EW145_g6985 [Phellinidium pouzarii]|uniref:Uncharacterized protein n=1 Tax=Phellinidium pouzarii TaxID=167371 RepID=A0A4S4KRW3_9AGAM|nr:hypothetical protein EW145_g6985 [Phellinidium pouzarii]